MVPKPSFRAGGSRSAWIVPAKDAENSHILFYFMRKKKKMQVPFHFLKTTEKMHDAGSGACKERCFKEACRRKGKGNLPSG